MHVAQGDLGGKCIRGSGEFISARRALGVGAPVQPFHRWNFWVREGTSPYSLR